MLAALLLAIFFASECQASDKTALTLFLPNTDWPPYVMDDALHPVGGILGEVMKAIAEPLGYSVTIKFLPERRGWEMLDQGLVDVHAKAREWVADPDRYLWTEPFLTSEDVLISPKDDPVHYTTPQALYGKRLAAIRGFVYPEFEEHFGPDKIIRVDVTTPFEMLQLLDRGRVDAAMVNKAGTLWMLKQHPVMSATAYHIGHKAFGSAKYRFLFSKKDKWKPVRDQFNQALQAMKKDGRLKAILDSYR